MQIDKDVVNNLLLFKQRRKFSDKAWEDRGLKPSAALVSSHLDGVINETAQSLISAVKENLPLKKLGSVIKESLKKIQRDDYDTEEREFICDVFKELGEIVNVPVSGILNKWLYGKLLYNLLNLKKSLTAKTILATLSQPCTNCNTNLETYVKAYQDGIPDANWFIVKCNACGEFNLLTLAPNITELEFGNYVQKENLFKAECTYEQAQARLDKLKMF